MVKKMNLGDIAEIHSGYTFREAIDPVSKGAISVLQAKDIVQNEPIVDASKLTKISLDLPRNNSYPVDGDILLISRATGPGHFRSALFRCKENNVVASSSLFIIRIIDKSVLPEYLSLYLNSSDGQNDLAQLLSGAYIKTVPKKNLAELPIPIPPIQIQKSLADLGANIKKQEKLIERRNEIKKDIINATLKNLILK